MLYKVGFRSANRAIVALVTTAATLAICLLALVETTKTAEAISLPENGKIAFSRFTGTSNADEIYTIEPDGSNLRRLTNSRSFTYNTRPIWSPDGKDIIFNYQGPAGEVSLKIMGADGSNLRSLPANETWGSDVTWLPDGTKLAFSALSSSTPPNDTSDIYTINPDGFNQTNLTKTPTLSEWYPAFSPDGSQMCFFRSNSPQQQVPDIYVMGIDGSDPTLLVEGNSQKISHTGILSEGCDWSPDGTKIAFHAIITGPKEGDLRKALEKALGEGDPKKILEKQRKLEAELDEEVYVINADGSGRTALTNNSVADLNVDWSPDGTKITFVSDRHGGFNIYTMDADGSDVAQVTTNSLQLTHDPDWQPLPGTTGVHPPDTGGPSLIVVASALIFSGGTLLYAGVRRSM